MFDLWGLFQRRSNCGYKAQKRRSRQMVQDCSYDDDCDELNFCHESTRICTQIGLYDPCRIPAPRGCSDPHSIWHGWNNTRWIEKMSVVMMDAGNNDKGQIYLPPMCPPELACSMSLGRCVKPFVGQKLVSLFELTSTDPALYYSRTGIYPPRFPMDTSYHFIDDRNTSLGRVCQKDVHCPIGMECFKNECRDLPGLNEYCSSKSGLCRKPFICSDRGVCSYPCLDDLDCARMPGVEGLEGLVMEKSFVCRQGGYCGPRTRYFDGMVWLTIVFPIVLVTVLIMTLISRRRGQQGES